MNKDRELLAQYAANGSEPAFAELVQRHAGLVYSAALRRTGGDGHAAADVAQAVFIALARNARKLSRHPVLAAWLYASTRNPARDFWRAQKRQQNKIENFQAMNVAPPLQPSETTWAEVRPELDAAMDKLVERDRQAIILRFFEGRAYSEIGEALRVTENGAQMRVTRALEKLRDGLHRRGITCTAAVLAGSLASEAVAAPPAGLSVLLGKAALAAAPFAGEAAVSSSFVTTLTGKVAIAAAGLLIAVAVGYSHRQVPDLERATGPLAPHSPFGQKTPRPAASALKTAAITPASSASDSLRKKKKRKSDTGTGFLSMSGRVGAQYVAALGLTDEEQGRIHDLVQSTRFALLSDAAAKALVKTASSHEVVVVLPPLDDASSHCSQFMDQLETILGPDRSAALSNQEETQIMTLFNAFGATAESIAFSRLSKPDGSSNFRVSEQMQGENTGFVRIATFASTDDMEASYAPVTHLIAPQLGALLTTAVDASGTPVNQMSHENR